MQCTEAGPGGQSGVIAAKLVGMALRAEFGLALTQPPCMEGMIAWEKENKLGNVSYDIAQVNKACPSHFLVYLFFFLLPPLLFPPSFLPPSPFFSPLFPPPSVDCVWEAWSDWTPCSLPCGGGLQFQTREKQQVEKYGGSPCDGPPVQNTTCNTHFCPSKAAVDTTRIAL